MRAWWRTEFRRLACALVASVAAAACIAAVPSVAAAASDASGAPDAGLGAVRADDDGHRTIRFATERGTRMNPDVAPDARTIAFDLLGSIYVVAAEGGEARRLTPEDSVDYRPKFSPDGSRIAFVSERDGTPNVWVMDADGSNPRNVTRQDPNERPKRHRFFITPSWLPDGEHVAVAVASDLTFYGSDDVLRFAVPRADGSLPPGAEAEPASLLGRAAFAPPREPRAVIRSAARPPFPREGIEPAFSADGTLMYYSVRTAQTRFSGEMLLPRYQVGVLDRRSNRQVVLTDAPLGAFSPAPSPDGRWLVYAARYGADTGLRLRDIRDGTDRWLAFPVDRDAAENWLSEHLANGISFAADSRSIVTSFDGRLWRIAIPGGERTPIPFRAEVARRIAPTTRQRIALPDDGALRVRHVEHLSPSPDGRRLAFGALGRIWIADADGRGVRRLTNDAEGAELHPAWTPDGRSIVYARFDLATRDGALYEARVDARTAPRRVTARGGYYTMPSYTPDGREIVAIRAPVTDGVLQLGMASGELVVQPRDGGAQRTLIAVVPGRAYVRPQVIPAEPDRVYFYEPATGLVSVPRAGGRAVTHAQLGAVTARRAHAHTDEAFDRRVYSALQGLGPQGGDPEGYEIVDAILNPAGDRLLIWSGADLFGTVHVLELDRAKYSRGDGPPPVLVGTRTGVKAGRLAGITGPAGGVYPFWSADGREPRFMIANHVFRGDPGAAPAPLHEIALDLERRPGVPPLLLSNARIVTMEGDRTFERGELLVRGKRLEFVGEAGTGPRPPGLRTIDLGGATVIPGMIDTHAHDTTHEPLAPPDTGRSKLENRLAYGVTTVFDPYAPLALFGAADLVESGRWSGARVLTTGPALEPNRELASLDDARALVQRYSRYYRTQGIKSYDIGGALNRRWLATAAREQRTNVAIETEGSLNHTIAAVLEGHAHLAHGIAAPIHDDVRRFLAASGAGLSYQYGTLRGEGGPSSIFHFLDRDFAWSDPKMNRTLPPAHHYAWWRRLTIDPTDHVFPYYSAQLAAVVRAGTPIALGDHGVYLGLGLHWELYAHGSRMPAHLALRAVTIDAARLLGLDVELGSLVAGKKADLVVLRDDPRENVRAVATITHVMRDGELYLADPLEQVWPERRSLPAPWWSGSAPEWRPGSRTSGGVPGADAWGRTPDDGE